MKNIKNKLIKIKISGHIMIEICLYAIFVLLLLKSGNILYYSYQKSKFNITISEIRYAQIDQIINQNSNQQLSCGAWIKSKNNQIVIVNSNDLGFFSLEEAECIKKNIPGTKIQESENQKYIILLEI